MKTSKIKIEIQRIKKYDNELERIWFIGEAIFHTTGRVECHNLIYYQETGSDFIETINPESPGQCITVWAAINAKGIIGPYIAAGNADSETYRIFLKKFTYELRQFQRLRAEIYDPFFIHNNSPIHEGTDKMLDQEFSKGWVGPGSKYANWPKLSPDLNPINFFLWGFIKNKVYTEPLEEDNVTELALRIYHAFTDVTPGMLMEAINASKTKIDVQLTIQKHDIVPLSKIGGLVNS
uniref:Tc1-like transposase DDE domain-containing protein n=1 Tax=Acrobeloides nanus TaxID=290746 RepID=A0A914DEE7_9BILA